MFRCNAKFPGVTPHITLLYNEPFAIHDVDRVHAQLLNSSGATCRPIRFAPCFTLMEIGGIGLLGNRRTTFCEFLQWIIFDITGKLVEPSDFAMSFTLRHRLVLEFLVN